MIPLLAGFKLANMMSSILPFLKKNWKMVIIVMLLGGIVFKYHTTMKENIKLHEQLAECKANFMQETSKYNERVDNMKSIIDSANGEIAKLEGVIGNQNAEVDKLHQAGEALKSRLKAKTVEILKISKDNDAEVQQILAEKGPETCEGSIQYLKDAVKDLIWEKKE